jgi:hypothetical protein
MVAEIDPNTYIGFGWTRKAMTGLQLNPGDFTSMGKRTGTEKKNRHRGQLPDFR